MPNVDGGEVCGCLGGRVYGNSALSTQFSSEPKTTLKNKIKIKNKINKGNPNIGVTR